jgi:hypothetical protein
VEALQFLLSHASKSRTKAKFAISMAIIGMPALARIGSSRNAGSQQALASQTPYRADNAHALGSLGVRWHTLRWSY